MTIDTVPDPEEDWVEEGDTELDLSMSDDDLEFTDYDNDNDNDIDIDEVDAPAGYRERVPLWRLIEMSREDRNLKMELADFEDYDVDEMAY